MDDTNDDTNDDVFEDHKQNNSEDNIDLKVDEKDSDTSLTAAQRARAERNRQKARALRDARLVQHPNNEDCPKAERSAGRALDAGGGFLLEAAAPAERAPRPAPAPVLARAEQPRCLVCDLRFPQSYLFDTFDYCVCDSCRFLHF